MLKDLTLVLAKTKPVSPGGCLKAGRRRLNCTTG